MPCKEFDATGVKLKLPDINTLDHAKAEFLDIYVRRTWGDRAERMITFVENPCFDPSDPYSPEYYGWIRISRLDNGNELWGLYNL